MIYARVLQVARSVTSPFQAPGPLEEIASGANGYFGGDPFYDRLWPGPDIPAIKLIAENQPFDSTPARGVEM